MPFHVIKKAIFGSVFMTYSLWVGGYFLDDYSQPSARFDTYTNPHPPNSGEKSKQEKGSYSKGEI